SDMVGYAYPTSVKYFETTMETDVNTVYNFLGQDALAAACLKCIASIQLKEGTAASALRKALDSQSFLSYAGAYWHLHLQEALEKNSGPMITSVVFEVFAETSYRLLAHELARFL